MSHLMPKSIKTNLVFSSQKCLQSSTDFISAINKSSAVKIVFGNCSRQAFYMSMVFAALKGLSHEIDFKNFDQTLKNLT
jgi:hypothetical protein